MNVSRPWLAALTLVALAPLALAEDPSPEQASYAACKKDLETYRGSGLKADVKLEPLAKEEQDLFREEILDRDGYRAGRVEPLGRLYARLGLVPKDYDLRKGLAEYLDTNKQPYYYGLRKKTILVAAVDFPEALLPRALFNQLCFARQDQLHDLWALHDARVRDDDDDGVAAIKFLSEGEAQWLFYVRLFTEAGKTEADAAKACEFYAKMTREQALEQARANVEKMGEKGKTLQESLDKLVRLPVFFYRRFVEAPMKGAAVVLRVKQGGGWEAVDALWSEPPLSTAQVLRPRARLLGGRRLDPTRVGVPDLSAKLGEGWKLAVQTTLGELGLESFIVERTGGSTDPARGALGDRCQGYETADGKGCSVWVTTWGKPEYATSFLASANQALALRYREARVERTEGAEGQSVVLTEGELAHGAWVRGTELVVVEGCPAASREAVVNAAFGATLTPSAAHPPRPEPPKDGGH